MFLIGLGYITPGCARAPEIEGSYPRTPQEQVRGVSLEVQETEATGGRRRVTFRVVNEGDDQVTFGLGAVMLRGIEGTDRLRPVYSLRVAPEGTAMAPGWVSFGQNIAMEDIGFTARRGAPSPLFSAMMPYLSRGTWHLATDVLFSDGESAWVTSPPIPIGQ
jgi:hypothetical protein